MHIIEITTTLEVFDGFGCEWIWYRICFEQFLSFFVVNTTFETQIRTILLNQLLLEALQAHDIVKHQCLLYEIEIWEIFSLLGLFKAVSKFHFFVLLLILMDFGNCEVIWTIEFLESVLIKVLDHDCYIQVAICRELVCFHNKVLLSFALPVLHLLLFVINIALFFRFLRTIHVIFGNKLSFFKLIS